MHNVFVLMVSHVILQVLPIKKHNKDLLVLSKICIYHVRGKMLLLQVCILSHQPKLKTLSEIIIVIHLPTFLYPVKSAYYLKEKCFKDLFNIKKMLLFVYMLRVTALTAVL